ncbi:sensor histidine kinase [Streptomyces sp. VRA16 Mangrove soil]|uniref:sensor histidine kinase n=1 Tax=Streptomyces sp. VRA16 Mangrove soil TaxID=2817434 RepID=UPI001A9DA6E6|nr:sensor histidine kinase [Streptomyces sp. VRA16 Mangrove soil]MBO1333176.1 sensor histidine kinase [Streptomyces sp. VRA16 Mangrove soil]
MALQLKHRWRAWQIARDEWKAENERVKAARKECKGGKEGRPAEELGPPPSGFALLPWLLMGLGAFSNLINGETPNPWIAGVALLTFNSLYIYVVFRAFDKKKRESRPTLVALLLMTLLTCGLAGGYGGNWLAFFPLLGLAVGSIVRGRHIGKVGIGLSALAGIIGALREGWDAVSVFYGTFLSTMVTAAILSLAETVRELRDAREELARQAVEKERLRFSRDLHDLLGHTLSVIVVKSEAARRLAPRSMDAALEQITDIEAVGRQALTEIREAVTGYREGSLATELDRARSALTAAGIEPVVRQSGPPPSAQTEALLGWVVREAVTNAVRHSAATTCTITVEGTRERVRLRVVDDGSGPAPAAGPKVGGTGLKGLTERLATAGGSLTAGPGVRGGFTVTAELPVGQGESARDAELAETTT